MRKCARALAIGAAIVLTACGINQPVRTTQNDDAGMLFGLISGVGESFDMYIQQDERAGIVYRMSATPSTDEGVFFMTDLPPMRYALAAFQTSKGWHKLASSADDYFEIGPGQLLFVGAYKYESHLLLAKYDLVPMPRPTESEVLAKVGTLVNDPRWKERIEQRIDQLAPRVDKLDSQVESAESTLGAPEQVTGGLAAEAIQKVVRENYAMFRGCYELGLARNPKLSGKLKVRFVIRRDGSVDKAEIVSDTLGDAKATECMLAAYRALAFPRPKTGKVTVVYPIRFSPE